MRSISPLAGFEWAYCKRVRLGAFGGPNRLRKGNKGPFRGRKCNSGLVEVGGLVWG